MIAGHTEFSCNACFGFMIAGHTKFACNTCFGFMIAGHTKFACNTCFGFMIAGHTKFACNTCFGFMIAGYTKFACNACFGFMIAGHTKFGFMIAGHTMFACNACFGFMIAGHTKFGLMIAGHTKFGFMIAGHTKFSCDACFGLVKKVTKRTFVSSHTDIAKSVYSSAETALTNILVIVGLENGKLLVPYHNWKSFLLDIFRPLTDIKKYHHFSFSTCFKIGEVCLKEYDDSEELFFNVLKHPENALTVDLFSQQE